MKYLSSAATAVLGLVATARPALAQWDRPDASGGAIDDGNISDVVVTVINFLLGVIGVLSVLMIVIAGILYVTSGGSEAQTSTAKNMIIYAIIGLVIALLGYVIVLFVADALGAN